MLNLFPTGGSSDDIINRTNFISRNAGQSPECYYFDDNEKGKRGKCYLFSGIRKLSAIACSFHPSLEALFTFLNINILVFFLIICDVLTNFLSMVLVNDCTSIDNYIDNEHDL